MIGQIIRDANHRAVIEMERLYGRGGKVVPVRARWAVWRALRLKRRMTFDDIASRTGVRALASVVKGIERLDDLMIDNPELMDAVARVTAAVPARDEVQISGPAVTRYPASPGLEDCPLQ